MSSESQGNEGQQNDLPVPSVLAINICDTIIRDEITKKVSLIGLFCVVRSKIFPYRHPGMHIYVALTNGHSNQECLVRLVRCEDQKVVFGMKGPLKFQSPLQVVEMNLLWMNFDFEKTGEYVVEVCFGKHEQLIGQRTFNVCQVNSNPPQAKESEEE